MSDSEDGNAKSDSSSNPKICHAFLRNACKHGANCRFRHPEDLNTGRKKNYAFCHDYQNTECRRMNCKFLHCTRQEEQEYRTTGELPKHVLESVDSRKSSVRDNYDGNLKMPVCKDHLKGECRRGNSCRFRHMTPSEYDMEVSRNSLGAVGNRDIYNRYDRFESYDTFEPELKRRAFDDPYGSHMSDRFGSSSDASNRMMPAYNEYRMLEEENLLLRRKVEELKKQIVELTATNEFLLDQNAQLRYTKQSTVTSVTQPMNSLNAMTQLTMSGMASELGMPLGTSVTLGQGYSYPQMSMNTQGSNLVSYPIVTQSLRSVMPHSLGQ